MEYFNERKVGTEEGTEEGSPEGFTLGAPEGNELGSPDGCPVGKVVGLTVVLPATDNIVLYVKIRENEVGSLEGSPLG